MPDSDIRATAEYDAAAALINLQAWDRASGVLEKFRPDYPDSQFADDVTQKLAVTYLESGDSDSAAAEFERIATAESSDDDVRREALWKASELYKDTGALSASSACLTPLLRATRIRLPNPLRPDSACWRSPGSQATTPKSLLDCKSLLQSTRLRRAAFGSNSLSGSDSIARARRTGAATFEVVKLSQPLANSLKLKKDADGRCYSGLYRRG